MMDQNYNELILCMDDLPNDDKYTMLIQTSVYLSLDKNEKERDMTVDLIQYLYIYSKCDVEVFVYLHQSFGLGHCFQSVGNSYEYG